MSDDDMGARRYGESEDADRILNKALPWNVEPYVQQEKIRTIHYGIGAIGSEVVKAVLNNPEIEIVAAIDAHPNKSGKDLGEAAGIGHTLGVPVQYEVEPILKDIYADVIIHCTGSSLTEVYPQLMAIVSAEKSVVSSCEELSFPWVRYPEISQKLDRRARETGVRVLGTGINPGFVMDLLPLMLLTACQQVKSVRVERVVDVATRRIQLQRKTGVGLSVQGFQRGASDGAVGHVGLRESLFMIADTLGWKLEDVSETLEPVIAREKRSTEYFSIERGYVAGLRQSTRGMMSGQEVLRLDLEMSLGARDPHDSIEIDARPPIKMTIPGGIHGDIATASVIANVIPAIARGRMLGLLSMRDLPLLPYYRPRPQPREAAE
ncbi:MAG: dihydrodipicolinate reductase [Dehalococcoidia bacterium]|nr:dihydrodipicolinate reductase [Dehalococcoidia bacterium]